MSALLRQLFTKACSLSKCNINTILPATSVSLVSNIDKSRFFSDTHTAYEVIDDKKDKLESQALVNSVNEQIKQKNYGRLFAVVHVAGKQFKITEGDVIVIEGSWAPDIGDRISLNKIMLIGSTDFSLIGCPLVQDGLATVEATVIEKTLSHTKTNFKKKRRKQYRRIHFYRIHHTMLRINKVELVDELK